MEKKLIEYIRSGHPGLYIVSAEEQRVEALEIPLGERRALATKNYFVGLGIAPGRLSVVSYGEEKPLSRGHNELAWEQNRRVEFK